MGCMRRSIIVVFALGVLACSAPDTEPISGDSSTGTGVATESESGETAGTQTTTDDEADPDADACLSDSDCPGTQICDKPSLYPNECIPCGECCSKVGCPTGFACMLHTHHNTGGACVPNCQQLEYSCDRTDDCCEGLVCVGASGEASCQMR